MKCVLNWGFSVKWLCAAFQEIDGDALLLLKSEMMMKYLGLKLGPAVKLCYHIDRLKQNRLWLSAKGPNTFAAFTKTEPVPTRSDFLNHQHQLMSAFGLGLHTWRLLMHPHHILLSNWTLIRLFTAEAFKCFFFYLCLLVIWVVLHCK